MTSKLAKRREKPKDHFEEQAVAEWDTRIKESLDDLTLHEVVVTAHTSLTRRLVAAHRLDHEMTAQAAKRIFVDRLRRSPRCFATQFSTTLWCADESHRTKWSTALEVDASISYTGIHLYVSGDDNPAHGHHLAARLRGVPCGDGGLFG